MLGAASISHTQSHPLLLALGQASPSIELEEDDVAVEHGVCLQHREQCCMLLIPRGLPCPAGGTCLQPAYV